MDITVWSVDISNTDVDVFTTPIIDKNNIVYIGSGNYIYALGDTGKMPYYRWVSEKFTIPSNKGKIYSACSVDSSGNFLYFGTTKGYIYKINAITGVEENNYPIKISDKVALHGITTNTNEYVIYAPICIVYDTSNNRNIAICSATYAYNEKGITIAIDTNSNSLLWQRENEYAYIEENITTTKNNGILLNGIAYNKFQNSVYISTMRDIVSLNVLDGAVRCRFNGIESNNPSVCFSTPTVDCSGNLLVSALNNSNPNAILHNKLYSLTEIIENNQHNFTTNWYIDIYDSERLSAAVIDASNNIWLTAKNKVHKLEFTI